MPNLSIRKMHDKTRFTNAARYSAILYAATAGISHDIARASTIVTTQADSSYINLSAATQYSASGFVNVISGGQSISFASGTLIASDWVLTAAHVVTVNGNG